MECNKHEGMIVLRAFSEGKCNVCNGKVITSHIPCNIVCDKCSNEFNLCVICGEEIKSETEKHENKRKS